VDQLGDHPRLQLLQREFAPVVEGAFTAQRARAAKTPADLSARMTQLAETFPTLAGQPALKFIAHVWSPRSRAFDLEDFAKWDAAHRQAFARWSEHPWWA